MAAGFLDDSASVESAAAAGKLLAERATRRRAIQKELARLLPSLLASWRPRSQEQRELLAKLRQLLEQLGLEPAAPKRVGKEDDQH